MEEGCNYAPSDAFFGSLTHHTFPCRMAAYLDVRAKRHLRCEAIDGIQHRRHP